MPAPQSPASTSDHLIGRRIGHYTIRRRIGQGGMGVVFEAVHDRIQQRVAIKVLHKEMSSDDKVVQRFFNEAQAISLAQHSSIVKIMDYGQLDDGTAYIMMEFLDGEPLLTRLERAQDEGKGLGLHMVVELSRQIAAALSVIHAKNIVHRDLKPENIFVVPDSVAPLGERVKLLDFGIAKFLDGPVRKTTVGMILGTPLYMSPEQCEGREDLNAQVDVYALGAMMFEMIAGRLPFHADTAAALMRQHMFKAAPRLRDCAQAAPQDLDDLIDQMLRKEPSERPTMTEIAQRLDQMLPGVSGKGSPLVEGVRIPRVPRRTGVGGDLTLDPLAETVGDVSLSGKTSKEQRVPSGSQLKSGPHTQPTVERPKTPLVVGALVLVLLGAMLATMSNPAQRTKPVASPMPSVTQPKELAPPPEPPRPVEPVTPVVPAMPAAASDEKAKATEPAEPSEPMKAGKAPPKKMMKMTKPVRAMAEKPADRAAAPAEPPAEKPVEKPVEKPKPKSATGSDIGVWRDP